MGNPVDILTAMRELARPLVGEFVEDDFVKLEYEEYYDLEVGQPVDY